MPDKPEVGSTIIAGTAESADSNGRFTPLRIKVDDNGAMHVKLTSGSISISGADGAVLDGVDPAIKATVKDLTNSNPLTVAMVDSNGDQVSSFGGGTQYTEDAVAAANPVGTVTILVRDDALTGSLVSADGDNVAARGNNKGEQYVKATDTDTILGAVTASPTANTVLDRLKTIATNLGAVVIAAGAALIGDVNLRLGGTAAAGNSGNASAQTLRVVLATDQPALTNKLLVTPDLPSGASTAAKQPALGTAGTPSADVISIQGVASMTAVQTGGNIAHDGVDAGNPHKMGGRAIAHGTNPTAVSAADRTDWLFNRAGIPWVIGGHPNLVTVEAAYTAAQTDTAIVTISSGLKLVLVALGVRCSNANTVNTGFRVGFGTANTPTTTGVVDSHPGVAPGSGTQAGDGSGIIGIGADNEDLRITSDVPTTGSLRVIAKYYTIES